MAHRLLQKHTPTTHTPLVPLAVELLPRTSQSFRLPLEVTRSLHNAPSERYIAKPKQTNMNTNQNHLSHIQYTPNKLNNKQNVTTNKRTKISQSTSKQNTELVYQKHTQPQKNCQNTTNCDIKAKRNRVNTSKHREKQKTTKHTKQK